ncbi:hypothetical protein LEP1GSC126_2060 [Leptospira kirschneri str. 200801774]|uniref:Uncharacterized protein n=1 Tax=Leptospira kirschneri str. 200802841 TaxID=1193047 RepID=A0A828Y9W9_9LEPT|nr:hypothetical protein LEP1GSC131_3395 [Leptospira kirschneri str. 200802841]EMO82603.1 hypothetical protein LEP1GSC126_2060 [Leptospira kirschneri str. 200801774]
MKQYSQNQKMATQHFFLLLKRKWIETSGYIADSSNAIISFSY